jgi:hypothetical protein
MMEKTQNGRLSKRREALQIKEKRSEQEPGTKMAFESGL